MKRNIFLLTGFVVAALIVVFLFVGNDEKSTAEENTVVDIKQLVNDYSSGNINDQQASITPQQLIVVNSDESKKTYDLPENEFFVSIAPFIETTHPCAVHSLTGCRGELSDKEFQVFIEDIEGKVVVDQKMKSQQNGFIDLWLPRDTTYKVTIKYEGKIAESELKTFENDNTCITTMQLL